MKQIIYSLLLLFLPLLQNGQNFEIKWGQEFHQKGLNHIDQKLIGHNNQYYYVLNRPKKEKELFQYDFNHKLIKVTPLKFEYGGKEIEIKQIINTASSSFLIGSSELKKSKKAHIHVSKIKPNGNTEKTIQHLFSYDFKRNDFFIADYERNKDAVGISISQDSTKVLFAYVNSLKERGKKKGNEIYNLVVFDEEMNELWKRKVEFPYTDKEITVEQIEISNSGEAFFLANIKVKEKRKYPLPPYDYKLFRVTQKRELQAVKIAPKDIIFPSESFLSLSKDGSVFVGGFFCQKNKKEIIREHGVFMVKYNQNLEEELERTHPWEKDFYTQLKEEYRIAAKISRSIYDLHIGNIIIDYTSKSITFVSEHRFTKKDNDDNQMYHYSNSLIISSLSFEGDLKWITCVNKDFSINEDDVSSSSYILGIKNENIYLIFNDEKTFKETKSMNLSKKFLTANFTDIVRINSIGEIDFQKLFFTSKEIGGLFFRPKFSKFIHEGRFILQCTNNTKSLFGSFILP